MNYVGTDTNSKDPALLWSRIFLGNLNTNHLGKEDVQHIFGRYGPISAISMHKGFAFVQFINEACARRAVAEEDRNQYAGMILDVNMAAEPKKQKSPTFGSPRGPSPRAPGAQMRPPMSGPRGPRPQATSTPRQMGPTPAKQFRSESAVSSAQQQANKRNLVNLTGAGDGTKPAIKRPAITPINKPRITSSDLLVLDILICGSCKAVFTSLDALTDHKDTPCGLKMSYKGDLPVSEDMQPESLQCASCDSTYANAWDLCQHVQEVHDLPIYKNETATDDMNGVKADDMEDDDE